MSRFPSPGLSNSLGGSSQMIIIQNSKSNMDPIENGIAPGDSLFLNGHRINPV